MVVIWQVVVMATLFAAVIGWMAGRHRLWVRDQRRKRREAVAKWRWAALGLPVEEPRP